MTAVAIQPNKIVLNEVKDNKVLIKPSYGEKQTHFLANPIDSVLLIPLLRQHIFQGKAADICFFQFFLLFSFPSRRWRKD